MLKVFPLFLVFLIHCFFANAQQSKLQDTTLLQPVELKAVRAGDKMPVTRSELSRAEIAKKNTGQDLPFILNQTPGVVVNSDAGNGVGYTALRIRGSDASRINLTLNGIPYNDAESQGTFLVNIPDIASSASNIQIQRGVGTSTNGAGAFGGSIHINTNEVVTTPGVELNNSVGSFGTLKNTIIANSGLLARHFTLTGRYSHLQSNGYVDRAETRLNSFFTSAAFISEKSSLRLNIFSGKEKTYQAWNGVDEETLKKDRRYNSAGREKSGEPYDNETDNYIQTHYQFFYNQQISKSIKGNVAVFLTKGKGYYEQYKGKAKLSSYGLPKYIIGLDTFSRTDLIRRKWLDNDSYGTIFSLQYSKAGTEVIAGGGLSRYTGLHYGEVIWSKIKGAVPAAYRYYDNDAQKNDFNIYGKWTERFARNFYSFADIQYRTVDYDINGFSDNPKLGVDNTYKFFNPKAGVTYLKGATKLYASYARANKEPNRDDFETGIGAPPKAESLNDFELGYEQKNKTASWGANVYLMDYDNQLVLTGEINDVGAYTRTNIKNSYRLGLELQGTLTISKIMNVSGNVAFSKNKVRNFVEYIDDYDDGGQVINNYKNTDIAFSPEVVASATLNILPFKGGEISAISKYVSRQYLDNTTNINRSLRGFYTQDLRFSYTCIPRYTKEVLLFAQVQNLFGKKYEPNGYTFSYKSGGKVVTENYYFPMATFNMVVGVNVHF